MAPQTASHFDCPSAVWCIRIPANGSPIERMVIRIVLDTEQSTKRVPFPQGWWWDKDPTAHLMLPTLHAQFDPPPLAGYYILFTLIDATFIPLNRYMGNRICGDAFLFRIDERRCRAEPENEYLKLEYMVYEDVPRELVDCCLLGEIMRPMEWKVLPPSNVVRLGFFRAQMREREEMGRKENEQSQREEMQRYTRQMWERQETERTKKEQAERDTREREQRQQVERERQETERQETERQERMAHERVSAAESLVALPYKLRSRTATALDPSLGEQRTSTPVPGPAPHDVPMPSVEEQHASPGANQFGFLALPGPSFAFTPGDRPAPPDVPGSSFAERHALTPFHGPMLHDATGSPFQEQHAPPNTGHRGAPEAFSREQRRFAAIYGAGFFHFPEPPSGEQNASAQGGSPGHPSGGQDPTAHNESPEQPPGEQMQKDSPDQEEIT
ncbi:MAG: hypothetical protein ASARMPRED_001537 [Alectoria sarmentosa]|nr:MAG: hypothetical protein ASARMPRED_001537 [Alectoria sarmentosa]